MIHMTARRVALAPLALTLSSALVLAGCSTGADERSADDGSTTPSATESSEEEEPYLPVPEGTELTPQGEQLDLGQTATVAYRPAKGKVGVVKLTVTKVERARIKDLVAFKLDKKAKKSTPYYVRARVRNVGTSNLAGSLPPLYVEDGQEQLVQASQFRSTFKPCPSESLPRPFKAGERTTGCWVYLVNQGEAAGVSYYPVEGFAPIQWTGQITGVGAGKKQQGSKTDEG